MPLVVIGDDIDIDFDVVGLINVEQACRCFKEPHIALSAMESDQTTIFELQPNKHQASALGDEAGEFQGLRNIDE